MEAERAPNQIRQAPQMEPPEGIRERGNKGEGAREKTDSRKQLKAAYLQNGKGFYISP